MPNKIIFHKSSPPKDGTTRIVGVFNDLGIDLNDVSIAEYDTYRKVWRLVGPYSVYYKKDPKLWAYYEDLEELICLTSPITR